MRPERLVVVCGTGTEIGKTWVSCRLLDALRGQGLRVAARKPAQSFDVDRHGAQLGGATDAELLAAATGEDPAQVCRPSRSYPRAMAPPMAADALGMATFTIADLVAELDWSDGTEVGVVETAGGVRSPQAEDGDGRDLVRALAPDHVVLVADAGLGTINSVRMSMDALTGGSGARAGTPVVVVLNRYDTGQEIHRCNRSWLEARDDYVIATVPDGLPVLIDALGLGPGV